MQDKRRIETILMQSRGRYRPLRQRNDAIGRFKLAVRAATGRGMRDSMYLYYRMEGVQSFLAQERLNNGKHHVAHRKSTAFRDKTEDFIAFLKSS